MALCVPRNKWELVLKEVKRVLTIGGRLELNNDRVFFPYGHSLANDVASTHTRAPAAHGQSIHMPLPATAGSQWTQQAAACRKLEGLFERMLVDRFGVSPRPSEFVSDLLMRVFGQAREADKVNVMLAHREVRRDESYREGGEKGTAWDRQASFPRSPHSKESESPCLIILPSTYLHVVPEEVSIHALRYPLLLLANKELLISHCTDAAYGGRQTHGQMAEAFSQYEG